MTSLADKAILSGADNHPPMLEKDMYDSWKSRMELYMLNRQYGMMILKSVELGPLLWPTVEEDGVTRLKKYSKLSAAEAIQADCDVKATNIILQGLPPEVYALVSTHKVAKELSERIQMLMQGTSLTKQERECKLYDEFDKFVYRKGETLRDYYLRFSLLLNDMNMYNMKLEQFQVNTKFLNTLPPEWSKFITDVKLVRDLHTTNVDQLHAYLGQQEYHANEVRLMHERTSDLLALISQHQLNGTPYQHHQQNDISSTVNQNAFMVSSSVPQIDYAPNVQNPLEFSSPETGLVVPVFQKGDDPIDAINHMMSFLTAVVTSRGGRVLCRLVRQDHLHHDQTALMANLSHYGFDNLADVNNHDNGANHLIYQEMQVPETSEQSPILPQSNTEITSDSNIISYSQYMNESQYNTVHNSTLPALQDDLILYVIEQLKTQVANCTRINQDNKQVNELLTAELERELALEKQAQQLKPKLYDGRIIENFDAVVIPDTEETLMLAEESLQTDEPNLSATTTIVEVPKELPKVSMVNSCSKKIKFHLASFDMVVKERTTATAITKGMWGFEHTKACFRDDIIPFVKALKELFTSFDQCLIDEVTEVQNIFKQMELAIEQHQQCDDLINKVNLKSAEVSDLNASLQEKVLVITALKEQLNKLKGKAVLTEAVSLNPIDPELLKVDVASLVPKLRKNRTTHTDYIRHTQEEAATLREIVESERLLSALNTSLDYALVVTPKSKTKQIRPTEQITKLGKTTVTTPPVANFDSNTPVLSSTGVILVSSASRSMSKDNTKKNRIR
nr:hypothetical protein [Tanacetum cinerariifolium]